MAQPQVQDGQAADPLWGYFQSVGGEDSQISAVELARALSVAFNQPFNLETAQLFIRVLDRDYSGQMGFTEFKELWMVVNEWLKTFRSYDKDNTGSIDRNELKTVLTSFGYKLSDRFYDTLMNKYDSQERGSIAFDAFMQCCTQMRMLTEQFSRHDTNRSGSIQIGYDKFLQIVFST